MLRNSPAPMAPVSGAEESFGIFFAKPFCLPSALHVLPQDQHLGGEMEGNRTSFAGNFGPPHIAKPQAHSHKARNWRKKHILASRGSSTSWAQKCASMHSAQSCLAYTVPFMSPPHGNLVRILPGTTEQTSSPQPGLHLPRGSAANRQLPKAARTRLLGDKGMP